MLPSVNELATLYVLGLATAEQENLLAGETLSVCLTVAGLAAGAGKIQRDDVRDVAADAAVRAFERIRKWDPARAGWKTYVSFIAKSEVGNQQRRYQRRQLSLEAAVTAAVVSGLAPSLSTREDAQEHHELE